MSIVSIYNLGATFKGRNVAGVWTRSGLDGPSCSSATAVLYSHSSSWKMDDQTELIIRPEYVLATPCQPRSHLSPSVMLLSGHPAAIARPEPALSRPAADTSLQSLMPLITRIAGQSRVLLGVVAAAQQC